MVSSWCGSTFTVGDIAIFLFRNGVIWQRSIENHYERFSFTKARQFCLTLGHRHYLLFISSSPSLHSSPFILPRLFLFFFPSSSSTSVNSSSSYSISESSLLSSLLFLRFLTLLSLSFRSCVALSHGIFILSIILPTDQRYK